MFYIGRFLILTILVSSSSPTYLSTGKQTKKDCASAHFRIESKQYGFVNRYPQDYYWGPDLLQFPGTQGTASTFCFTSDKALIEVNSGKCVISIYGKLALTHNCYRQWVLKWKYDSNKNTLSNVKNGLCFSPWNFFQRHPHVSKLIAGLSPCGTWNNIILRSYNTAEKCFDRRHVDYIQCTRQTKYNPGVCDCKQKTVCYIGLEFNRNNRRRNNGYLYSINGERTGPTIIISHRAILAVDIINNMEVETTIHWHGMHQYNVPWMDGVPNVTQYSIPANGGKFRYILRAHPSGTYWYHSHVRFQRNRGILGALIVKERNGIVEALFRYPRLRKGIVDAADKVIVVTEDMKRSNDSQRRCNLDGSAGPVNNLLVDSFQINGIKLQQTVHKYSQKPFITADRGKNYRFRIIGATEDTVFRISIDGHKLIVVATDGYLTKPFETDILHIHAGERYDFVAKLRHDVRNGNVFPIRIESVRVYCNNHDRPSRVGIAYLRYKSRDLLLKESRCTKNCIALNCPFARYPIVENNPSAPYYRCYNVYNALRLLHPTSRYELRFGHSSSLPATAKFFNHGFNNGTARINNIQLSFPTTPFVMNGDKPVAGQCSYSKTRGCSRKCPHVVQIRKEYKSKFVEFVFSSLPRGNNTAPRRTITGLITHPIHLHGHSFWVTKIGYPEYFKNGTIKRANDDIDVPDCGPGKWKNGVRPRGILMNERTLRKDVIIVPAGGYVVVQFKIENPGWWIMHCHIDRHLNEGMGIIVGSIPECQNAPPAILMKPTKHFCLSVEDFKEQEKKKKCRAQNFMPGTTMSYSKWYSQFGY